MQFDFKKKFIKDAKKIQDKTLLNKLNELINEVAEAKKLSDISNLKKLQGFDDCFRVAINDFRVGLIFTDNVILFARFLHRKDIYKKFP